MNKTTPFQPGLLLTLLLIAGLVTTAALIPIARAEAITVTTTNDDVINNGNCTLREAVIAANTDTAVDACPAGNGADTIILSAGTYRFTVGGYEDAAQAGDLDITADLTIEGANYRNTIIDADGVDRVFHISAGTIDISKVTIKGGTSFNHVGSGIFLYSGTLLLKRSQVVDNVNPEEFGGGIYVASQGSLTVHNSTIANNTSESGAGIYNNGVATIPHCKTMAAPR